MKIQRTPNIQLNSRERINQNTNSKDVAFKGGEVFVQFLKFIETNPAWGATAIDVCCMGIPRTTVDFTRGPEAGLETMRREFSSTIDDALVGSFGFVAAMALAQNLNKHYNVKAHEMFASDEMLNILSHTWNEKRNAKEPVREYLSHIFENIEGFNPEHVRHDKKGWTKIGTNAKTKVVDRLAEEIKPETKEISKATKAYLKSVIMTSVGSENKFKLEKNINGKIQKTIGSLDSTIDNICKISNSFVKPEVIETFKNGDVAHNKFIGKLKHLNKGASIIGLAIAAGIGVCLQPINMYLTKKKTGKSGFVGVEGKEPDKSTKFKILKVGVASLAAFAFFKNIGKAGEMMNKLQFRGLTPTIPQYKLVYGATIVSRLLSARDKNELRECSIKDSLGYVSWLIIGGFVSKLTAAVIERLPKFSSKDEKFIRHNKLENGSKWYNWLTKANIISREEVLQTEFKKAGLSTLTNDAKSAKIPTLIKDGKRALTFKEMLKIANTNPKLKMAKSKIKYLNLIQFAGYLYSGIVLGVGIPKLNIGITKAIEKKRKTKMEKQPKLEQISQSKPNDKAEIKSEKLQK